MTAFVYLLCFYIIFEISEDDWMGHVSSMFMFVGMFMKAGWERRNPAWKQKNETLLAHVV